MEATIAAAQPGAASAAVSPDRRPRLLSIQVCRGLAAMLVVMDHLHNVELKYFHSHFLAIFQYGIVGVDLFFIISGYVIASVTLGRKADRTPGRFLYHRLTRVYPIYWIYTAIVAAAYLYNPLWINASAGHHADIAQSFLLYPTGVPMLVMQGWTLTFEVYFYFVIFLTLLLPRKLTAYLLGLWAVVIIGFSVLPHVAFSPIGAIISSASVLEFLAGYLLFELVQRVRLPRAAGWLLIAFASAWMVTLVAWSNAYHLGDSGWIMATPWARTWLLGPLAFAFLFGLVELERLGKLRTPRFLVALGDWSYSIYLSHLILVELTGRAFVRFFPQVPAASLIVCAIALPLAVLIGWLSYQYLEQPMLAMFKRVKPARARLASSPAAQ